jgi:hypothetical protein
VSVLVSVVTKPEPSQAKLPPAYAGAMTSWRQPIVQVALAQTPSRRGWNMEFDISLSEASILSKFICPPRDMPKGLMRGYSFVAD